MKTFLSLLFVIIMPNLVMAQCPPTSYIGVTNITATSAQVSWTPVGQALWYYAGYKPINATMWTDLGPSTSTSVTLNNLQPGTTYSFRVQVSCAGPGSLSTVTQTSFTTPGSCSAPGGLSATTPSATQANIQWNAVAGANSYVLEYKTSAATAWTIASASITGTSYTLNNLLPSTVYNYRVKSNCGGSLQSGYSTAQFSTPASCGTPANLVAGNITPGSAVLSWTAVAGATSYQVEFGNSPVTGLWNVYNTVNNTYTLTGLNPSTTYDFRVRAICAAGNSNYTQIQFTTIPCLFAYEPNDQFNAAIAMPLNQVIYAGIGSTGGYVDNDYFSVTTAYIQDLTILLSNLPDDYILELYNSAGNLLGSSNQPATANEQITLYAQAPGTFTIRVFAAGITTSPVPCYQLQAIAQAPVACGLPLNAVTTTVTHSSATFTWNAVGGANSYSFHYRPVGGSVLWPPAITTTSTSATVNGLIPGTLYEWEVRANCAAAGSAYTAGIFFSTALCPPTPGTSLSNPISIGQVPCAGNPYSNTQTNTLSNCFSDNLTAVDNQSSPDIWYRFSLQNSSTVEIRTCTASGNNLDTWLHLLNAAGQQIASNNDNGPLCPGSKASLSVNLQAGDYYLVAEGAANQTGPITTTVNTTWPCTTTLIITGFIEGYYSGNRTMSPVMTNQSYPGFPPPLPTDVDEVIVELHDSYSPYQAVTSALTRLQTNGTMICNFPAMTGNYYIVVRHRNALQTWSNQPQAITPGTVTYDFSSAASQAYGNNMKQVEPGVWAFFSGDIDVQDENIDNLDGVKLDLDIINGAYGYIATDLNGDGNADLLDDPILWNNIMQFLYSQHP